jgi:hypothetical protein
MYWISSLSPGRQPFGAWTWMLPLGVMAMKKPPPTTPAGTATSARVSRAAGAALASTTGGVGAATGTLVPPPLRWACCFAESKQACFSEAS